MTRRIPNNTEPPATTTTQIPFSPLKQMSTTTEGPQSKLPPGVEVGDTQPPSPKTKLKAPKVRLRVNELNNIGARAFLHALDGLNIDDIVVKVLELLYARHSVLPSTRSVTLIVRPFDGIAYTTGSDLDDDHKEIHFSTHYFSQVDESRRSQEILGVITHELVHCFQYNGLGTCPGGLIEGIADFVRLKAGYVPPHWQREAGGKWDAGYQHTGYFLDFLEQLYGEGSVRRINEALRSSKYEEKVFWQKIFGSSIDELWKHYKRTFET